jgi:hypothetical protein
MVRVGFWETRQVQAALPARRRSLPVPGEFRVEEAVVVPRTRSLISIIITMSTLRAEAVEGSEVLPPWEPAKTLQPRMGETGALEAAAGAVECSKPQVRPGLSKAETGALEGEVGEPPARMMFPLIVMEAVGDLGEGPEWGGLNHTTP